jgi:hypothetical protein
MHLPGKMIDAAANLGGKLKVDHLIGSFRPSEFGKLKPGLGWDMDFWEYCLMKKSYSDKPIDHWLGSLWHKGMKMLAPDYQAMAVQVSLEEFESYKQTYQPDMWQEIKPKVWECGEVGTWYVQADYAEYIESNVWGELPIK